jgi:hypothetical protein
MELAEILLADPGPDEEWVLNAQMLAQRTLLAESRHVRTANFRTIHTRDLAMLFDLYDKLFLEGRCRKALDGTDLRFRFAPRMTKSAGTTSKFVNPGGAMWFEISIASSMLFDGFTENDHREVTVCGVECVTRLDALQRVFEHELVHLMEFLCWGTSNCSGPRFQGIASSWFLHRTHTHALITRRERAAASGIRPGTSVRFVYEGRLLRGVVNRVTKRATVLVEDPEGRRYSDGKLYRKYYIPIEWLEPAS